MRKNLSQNPFLRALVILALIGLCLIAGGYGLFNMFFHPATRVPPEFPDTNIVYHADGVLGFINADGSGASTVYYLPRRSEFAPSNWGHPLITSDNQYLIVTNGLYPVSAGDIYVGQRGQYAALCKEWKVNYVQLIAGKYLVLSSPEGLVQYSPEDCNTNNPPEKNYAGTLGYLSPDEQSVAKVEWVGEQGQEKPMITILELNTGLQKVVGPGNFAAWSPDNRWVAYTGTDGIYVVNAIDTTEPRLVVVHQNPDETKPLYQENGMPSLFFPPMVAWSPDGKWLVYHLYRDGLGKDSTGSADFYAIYKLNIQTGEETKLINGGLSPYWRWPMKEP